MCVYSADEVCCHLHGRIWELLQIGLDVSGWDIKWSLSVRVKEELNPLNGFVFPTNLATPRKFSLVIGIVANKRWYLRLFMAFQTYSWNVSLRHPMHISLEMSLTGPVHNGNHLRLLLGVCECICDTRKRRSEIKRNHEAILKLECGGYFPHEPRERVCEMVTHL
jgi:hypothetical protein